MEASDDGFDGPVDSIRYLLDKGHTGAPIYAAMRGLVLKVEMETCFAYMAEKYGGAPAGYEEEYLAYCKLTDGDNWKPDKKTIQWVLSELNSLIEDRMSKAKRPRKQMNATNGLIGAVGNYVYRQFKKAVKA